MSQCRRQYRDGSYQHAENPNEFVGDRSWSRIPHGLRVFRSRWGGHRNGVRNSVESAVRGELILAAAPLCTMAH